MSEQFVRNLSKNCYFLGASAKRGGDSAVLGRRIHFQQTKSSYLIGDIPSTALNPRQLTPCSQSHRNEYLRLLKGGFPPKRYKLLTRA